MYIFKNKIKSIILLLSCFWIFILGSYVCQGAGWVQDNTTSDEQAAEQFMAMPVASAIKSLTSNAVSSIVFFPAPIEVANLIYENRSFVSLPNFYSPYQIANNHTPPKFFQLFSNYRL